MCIFIAWYPLEFSRLHNEHPLVLELSLIQSHLLWGEFSIWALCCNYSQSLQFSFRVPPSTHYCWVDRRDMIWEACPAPLHMAGSVTRAPVTHPSTNQARRCLTLTLPGPSAGVSGSLDSYCSLKSLCSGMGEVVLARTSPTLLPPSPRTLLSLSCFKVSQCINCRD